MTSSGNIEVHDATPDVELKEKSDINETREGRSFHNIPASPPHRRVLAASFENSLPRAYRSLGSV